MSTPPPNADDSSAVTGGRPPLSARAAAASALERPGGSGPTAQRSLDDLISRQGVRPDEIALARELVLGASRHRLTLMRILDRIAAGGWKRIQARLKPILLLGAYQLIWLDGIPEFAAVHETVEQAKARAGPRAGRFANALLRDVLRAVEHRRLPIAEADPIRAVIVTPQSTCQFRLAVLPDPAQHPIEHLSALTSHPARLVSHWTEIHGPARARSLCLAGMFRPPTWCRPNAMRTTGKDLRARLAVEGIEAKFAQDIDAVVVPTGTVVTTAPAFRDGLFQPQDRTAMAVVRRMDPKPGQRVLDLCAGLGTKTTQLAEHMRDQGRVLAADKDDGKLDALEANCRRLGLTCVRRIAGDTLEAETRAAGPLDWILVDAPCSNSGVLARRPEARYRITPDSITELAAVQRMLLDRAAGLATERTAVAYSTCSVEPSENEEIVRYFCSRHAAWRLTHSELILPCHASDPLEARDGGFFALWVREQAT